MNRRRFIQSVAAVLSLPVNPALSLRPAIGAVPAAVAVPANARSWAVYMSTLHGECTPQALQAMLNIPAVEAKKYITQLVADGVIKTNPLLQRTITDFVKPDEDNLLSKVKKRLEMKGQAETEALEDRNFADESQELDAEVDFTEDGLEPILEDSDDDISPANNHANNQLFDETDGQA